MSSVPWGIPIGSRRRSLILPALAVLLLARAPSWDASTAAAEEGAEASGESAETPAGEARRAYITLCLGASVLTADTGGDVIDQRAVAQAEVGLGWRLRPSLLFEATFAGMDRQRQSGAILPVAPDENPPETETAYEVIVNPIMLRLRFFGRPSRQRAVHPEMTVGVGLYSVTRTHRTRSPTLAYQTNLLIPAVELGAAATYDLNDRVDLLLSARYTATQKRGIVDDTNNLSAFTFYLGGRLYPTGL
jgi:hypothetical protein